MSAPRDQLVSEIIGLINTLPKDEQEMVGRCGHKLMSVLEAYEQNGLLALALLSAQQAAALEHLTQPQTIQVAPPIEEIHNVWTIYGMDSPTKEAKQPLAAMGTRPQDWGHPRWTYHRFRFEWQTDPKGKPTVFHCHCWTDLKRKPHEYLTLFLPLFAYASTTGKAPELCGREFLVEDDFWEKKWGERPPIFEEERDDFYLEDIDVYG